MINRPSLQDFRDYKSNKSISHTDLKDVLRGGKSKQSPALTSGSVIDCFLTVPELIHDLFTIAVKIPSDRLREVLEASILRAGLVDLEKAKPDILEVARELEYDRNKSDETLWASITSKGGEYWDFMLENIGTGKTVISEKERSFGYEISQRVKRHIKYGSIFTVLPDRTTYFQKFLFSDYQGHKIKGAVDALILNESTMVATIIDFKTLYNLSTDLFFSQAREFGYPRQLSFYKELVASNFPDFEVRCAWLLIPKNMNNFDLNFITCPPEVLEAYKTGFFAQRTGEWQEGWEPLLSYAGSPEKYHSRTISPDVVKSQFL